MKQGTGTSRAGSQKVEPKSHAINPGGAADIGRPSPREPLNASRGYSAPKASASIHKCGSQGKH